jgi:phosphinothricin acetyltransferase
VNATTTHLLATLLENHFDAVREIYEQGIRSGDATFETTCPPWDQWNTKHLPHSRFVVIDAGVIAGWAALSPVSERCVYEGVAEVSVYVRNGHHGKGIGFELLQALVQSSEEHGIWTLQAGIFPENKASIHLHEKCGFKTVGIRERLGKMGDRWRDVVLMERRSERY